MVTSSQSRFFMNDPQSPSLPGEAEAARTTTVDTVSVDSGTGAEIIVNATSVEKTTSALAVTSDWSGSLSMVLNQPPAKLPIALLAGGCIFTASAGAWSWFGHVNEVSRATGRLVPQGRTFQVHPTMMGKVTTLAVKEGQMIEKGQVLALLDMDLARNEVERLQQLLMSHRQEILQRQAMVEQVRQEAQTRQEIAAADYRSQSVTIAQARSSTATLERLQQQREQELINYQRRVDHIRPLVEEGALSREQLFEREQQLQERRNALIQNQGDLTQAIAEQERLQAQLEQKQAEGKQSQISAQQRIQAMEAELTSLKSQMADTQNKMDSARKQLEQLQIVAPVSGVISHLAVRNPGEVVQPGQVMAEIRPAGAPLVLQAIVTSKEAGLIQPGMMARLKFDAFPYQEYGLVPGTVISMAPDSQILEEAASGLTVRRKPLAGTVVYRLDIALEQTTVSNRGQPVMLQPGQTAQAEIVIRRRRILELLLDPIQKIQNNGVSL